MSDNARIREILNDIDDRIGNLGEKSHHDVDISGNEESIDQKEKTDRNNLEWCDKSLDQLELSISLLEQCICGDKESLKRQQESLTRFQSEIEKMKRNYH